MAAFFRVAASTTCLSVALGVVYLPSELYTDQTVEDMADSMHATVRINKENNR